MKTDRLGAGKVISTLVGGTKIIRLADRDDCSDTEVAQLKTTGVRVLSLRHIEAFLYDDEVLVKLCQSLGKPGEIERVLKAKKDALEESIRRGNPTDDVKSAAGPIYVEVKRVLALTRCGNNSDAFCRDTLAPLITPDMAVYRQLHADIFE